MKKLKRFIMNSSQYLSREEMAIIEGSDIIAVDAANCTFEGQTCVYAVSPGTHSTVTLGRCVRHTSTDGGMVDFYYTCD